VPPTSRTTSIEQAAPPSERSALQHHTSRSAAPHDHSLNVRCRTGGRRLFLDQLRCG
jgi:hypothetical protein